MGDSGRTRLYKMSLMLNYHGIYEHLCISNLEEIISKTLLKA